MDLIIGGRSGLREADECAHEAMVYLGSGGGATYRLCEACGSTIVSQAGRLFVLRPRALAHTRGA